MRIITIFLVSAALTIVYLSSTATPPVRSYGEAQIGGSFALTDTQGRAVSDSDFRGRLMLAYMGYSHCPDICPMALTTMGETLKTLGPDANKIAVLFISLDPERDTPQALKTYLAAFDARIIGLTGTKQQVAQAAKAYKAFYKKGTASGNGDYTIDHSGFLYLMDRNGKYLAHFPSDIKQYDLTKAIRGYL